jgi:hypothetical protein
MYIIGHSTFAYLLLRPFFSLKKEELDFDVLLFIFIFANLPDILHFSFFRLLTHNLIGTYLFACFWLIWFYKFNLIQKKHIPFYIVATSSHVIADFVLSDYYFFYPLNNTHFSVFGFNSYEDLLFESIILILFIITIIFTKDIHQIHLNPIIKSNNYKELLSKRILIFLLFLLFYLFSLGQFLIFYLLNNHLISNFTWYAWFFQINFIIFLGILTLWMKKFLYSSQFKSNNK